MPHLGTLWSTDHAVLSQSQKLAKSPRRFPLVEIFIRRIPGSGKGAIGNARKECNHRRHDPCCRLCWGLNGDRSEWERSPNHAESTAIDTDASAYTSGSRTQALELARRGGV